MLNSSSSSAQFVDEQPRVPSGPPAVGNLRAARQYLLRSKAGPNSYVEAVRGVGLGSIALTFVLATLPTLGVVTDGTSDGLPQRIALIAQMGAEMGRAGVATLTALLTVMIPLALVRLARPGTGEGSGSDDDVSQTDRVLHGVVLFLGAASLSVLTLTVMGLGASRPTTAATVASVGLTAIPAAGIAVWLSSTILSLPSQRDARRDQVVAASTLLADHIAKFAPQRIRVFAQRRWAIPMWSAIVLALLVAWSIMTSDDVAGFWRAAWSSMIVVAWAIIPPVTITTISALTRRRSGDWFSLVAAFLVFGFLDAVYITATVDLAARGRILSAVFLAFVLLVPILAVSLPQRLFGPIALASALIGGLERTERYRVRLLAS